jgi:hypothetical protein
MRHIDIIFRKVSFEMRSMGLLGNGTGWNRRGIPSNRWEIRNRVSVRFQACFNACTSTMQFSPLGHEDWHARASQAAPLFEIISSQIDTLRKSQCLSKCLRKSQCVSKCLRFSQSTTGSLRSSQTIQSCIFGRTMRIVNNEN